MEVSVDIVDNFIMDCCKKEVHPVDRASIIRQRMISLKINSVREFGRKYNISHSTIQEWMSYEKINKEEYQEMLKRGYTRTDITKALRVNNKEKLQELFLPFDKVIVRTIDELKIYTREKFEVSNHTSLLLHELKNTITKIETNLRT